MGPASRLQDCSIAAALHSVAMLCLVVVKIVVAGTVVVGLGTPLLQGWQGRSWALASAPRSVPGPNQRPPGRAAAPPPKWARSRRPGHPGIAGPRPGHGPPHPAWPCRGRGGSQALSPLRSLRSESQLLLKCLTTSESPVWTPAAAVRAASPATAAASGPQVAARPDHRCGISHCDKAD